MTEFISELSRLKSFLNEIIVTEVWETYQDGIYFEDETEPIIDLRILLFNGLTSQAFYHKFIGILNDVRKSLNNFTDLIHNDSEPKNNYTTVIKECILKFENRSLFNIKLKNDKITEGGWEVIDHHLYPVFKALKEQLEKEQSSIKSQSIISSGNNPLRWNENVNKLVDIFFQLSNELKNSKGDPLIETKPSHLAYFIVNNFVDEDGEPLNFVTVQTYLKPSKEDKRPYGFDRIKIKYIP